MTIKKIFFHVLLCLCVITPWGSCYGLKKDEPGWWFERKAADGILWTSYTDYLLGGCSGGLSGCTGTYSDEGCIVLNIARIYNERGGYFCPTQIQVGNNNGSSSWIDFYKASASAPCKWICVDGYKGENCAEMDDGSDPDAEPLTALKKGGKTGNNSDKLGSQDVYYFNSSSGDRWPTVVNLVIMKYLEHGVVVTRATVAGKCDGDSKPYCDDSWVEAFSARKDVAYLLCADGFKRNADNSDCVRIDPNADIRPWCTGWDQAAYKANQADFEIVKDGDCKTYRCADKKMAFATGDINDRTCTTCVDNPARGGPNKVGVCTKCPVGQVFDSADNVRTCKPAMTLSRNDLQYGQGKNKSADINSQCWIKTDPSEYRDCVFNRQSQNSSSGRGRQLNLPAQRVQASQQGGQMQAQSIGSAMMQQSSGSTGPNLNVQ